MQVVHTQKNKTQSTIVSVPGSMTGVVNISLMNLLLWTSAYSVPGTRPLWFSRQEHMVTHLMATLSHCHRRASGKDNVHP